MDLRVSWAEMARVPLKGYFRLGQRLLSGPGLPPSDASSEFSPERGPEADPSGERVAD
jgi:hypothetical protein